MQKGLARLVHLRKHLLQMLPVDRLAQHFHNLCNGQIVQIPDGQRPSVNGGGGAQLLRRTDTVMFTLRGEGNILCRVYLPKRYATNIDEDDIQDICQGGKQYKLVYFGIAGQAYSLNLFL